MTTTILGYLMLMGGVSTVALSIARMRKASQDWHVSGPDHLD